MNYYNIYITGLLVGCVELTPQEVNNYISDESITIIEKK